MFEIPIIYCDKSRFYKSLKLRDGYRLIYSYEHDSKYYIGQTNNIKVRHKSHRTHHERLSDKVICKYALEPRIIWMGLRADTDDAEMYFIDQFDSMHPNGYNLESGGHAFQRMSDETRRKMSIVNKGENNPNYGKKWSDDVKKRMGEGRKGKGLGHKMTEENKCKLIQANRNRVRTPEEIRKFVECAIRHNKSKIRPVLQYDSDGNFMKEWESAISIFERFNLNRNQGTNIYANLCGRCKGAYGYIFTYKQSDDFPKKIEGLERKTRKSLDLTD